MRSRPLGITIIALILAISGVLQLVFGTEALHLTSFGLTAAGSAASTTGWASIISGVLTIIVAGGLFTLAGWAWLLAVIVLVVRIIADMIAALSLGIGSTLGTASVVSIVISAIILWYFQRASVKAAFGR